jgi:hypothetical protein
MSLVFDIETSALTREEILASVPPFDRDNVKLGNRKTPEAILKYMESAEEEYYEHFVERAALDARTATVLCIGYFDPFKPGGDALEVKGAGESERAVVSDFWMRWDRRGSSRLVGFNILRFDLPFMVRRSWQLGIPVHPSVFDGRYFNRGFIDLATYWQMGNRDEMISLDALARFLGLPGKKGNGLRFSHLWKENREEAIEYLRTDLEITTQAARRMMLL